MVRVIISESGGDNASEGRLHGVEELVEDEKLRPFCHDGLPNVEMGELGPDSNTEALLELVLCGNAGL